MYSQITHQAKRNSKDKYCCYYKKYTCFIKFSWGSVCLWENRCILLVGYEIRVSNLGFAKGTFFCSVSKLHTAFYTVHSILLSCVAFYNGANTKLLKNIVKCLFKLRLLNVSYEVKVHFVLIGHKSRVVRRICLYAKDKAHS